MRTRRGLPSNSPSLITGQVRGRVEMASPRRGTRGKTYPLDLPEVIQSICPTAQHVLALCQLGHQVFEVVLGLSQGPLVGEVAGGTIGIPSPWIQSPIFHQLLLTLRNKENGVLLLPCSQKPIRGRKKLPFSKCHTCLFSHRICMMKLQVGDIITPVWQIGN